MPDAVLTNPSPLRVQKAPEQGPPLVLVADDDDVSRRIVAAKLVSFRGRVIEAGDGIEAMSQLLGHRFDLAIIDLDMPRMSGLELIGCVRGHPRLSHIPIVVLTGSQSDTSINEALLAGATSFLLKPLNWTAFGSHIKHLMNLRQNA